MYTFNLCRYRSEEESSPKPIEIPDTSSSQSWYAPTADDLYACIGVLCADVSTAGLPSRYLESPSRLLPSDELVALCEEAVQKDVYEVAKLVISTASKVASKDDNFEVAGKLGKK